MEEIRAVFAKHGFDIDKINISHFGFTEHTPISEIDRVLNLVGLQSDIHIEDDFKTKKGIRNGY